MLTTITPTKATYTLVLMASCQDNLGKLVPERQIIRTSAAATDEGGDSVDN